MSNIAKIDSCKPLKESLTFASHVLRKGGIVAFPTESFYGLGVDATNTKAIRRLFKLKKRENGSPLLVLVSSFRELSKYTISIPIEAKKIGRYFWPGGITMVFKAGPILPPELTGGKGKIGIRVSDHPIARGLSQAVDFPITATSANLSGAPPCTSADQVAELFGNSVDLIIDSGVTEGKNASTVIDVTVKPPAIIREGLISMERLINKGIPVKKPPYSKENG